MTLRSGLLSLAVLIGGWATPSVAENSGEEPAFAFDRQEFYLRSTEGGILEYLPADETFEKWHTLMAVREFAGTDDPKAYAQKLLENAKASSEHAQGQLMENDEAGSYIADFVVYSEEGAKPFFAEWNLWRVEKKGDGVEAVQYAQRFYEITDDTPQEIIKGRERIVPLLAEFKVPALEAAADEHLAEEEPADHEAAPASSGQTYSYPDAENPLFSMELPADWVVESDAKGAWIVSADKHFTTSVVVVDSADATDAVESIKKQSGGRFASVEWSDPVEKIDEATGVIFQGNEGLAEDKGVKHKVGVYLFTKNSAEKAFILSTWTPEAAVDDNSEGCMKMFTSVKLK